MIYLPTGTYRDEVSFYDTSGALAIPSVLTGTLVVNGTDKAATVTLSSFSTGIYKVSCPLTGQVANGDHIYVRVQATVGSLSQSRTLHVARVDSLLSTLFGGTGANAVTVNVKDGNSANVQGASVTMTSGSDRKIGTTDASGNASFSLDAGTWTLAITKSGYQYTPSSQPVTGAGTINATITAVNVSPSVAPLCTCTLTNHDTIASYYAEMIEPPTTGGGYNDETQTADNVAVDALASFTLYRTAKYRLRRTDQGAWREFTVPDADTASLPTLTG